MTRLVLRTKLTEVRYIYFELTSSFQSFFGNNILYCESWTVKKAEWQKNWYLQTVVLEKTPESSLDSKEIKPVNLKGDQPWIFTGRTDAEAPAVWTWSSSPLCASDDSLKSPWCWERSRAEGEEGIRGWDGWMASLMQWTWTWANFGRWWGTDGPGVLGVAKSQTRLMSKPPLLLPQLQYPSIDLIFSGLIFSYLLWCHMP